MCPGVLMVIFFKTKRGKETEYEKHTTQKTKLVSKQQQQQQQIKLQRKKNAVGKI